MSHESGAALIQQLWQQRRSPIVSGVLFGTGEIAVLTFERMVRGVNVVLRVELSGRADVAGVLRADPDMSTELTELCQVRAEERNLEAVAGEGSAGGDGFLALTRLSDGHLNWMLFVENSNPFVEVGIRGSEIIAVTTLDDLWTVPLVSPEQLTVRPGNRRGWDSRARRLTSGS